MKMKSSPLISLKQKMSLKALLHLLQQVVEPLQTNEITLLMVINLKDLIKPKKVTWQVFIYHYHNHFDFVKILIVFYRRYTSNYIKKKRSCQCD